MVFADEAVEVVLSIEQQMPREVGAAGAVAGAPVPVVVELGGVLGVGVEHGYSSLVAVGCSASCSMG